MCRRAWQASRAPMPFVRRAVAFGSEQGFWRPPTHPVDQEGSASRLRAQPGKRDASAIPAAPLPVSELALQPARRGRRGRRRRALALINYLRHSGVGLPAAIWLRYGRELQSGRAGERHSQRGREKKGRNTREEREEKPASRGSPRALLSAVRRRGWAGEKPAGEEVLPQPHLAEGLFFPLLHISPVLVYGEKENGHSGKGCVRGWGCGCAPCLFHLRSWSNS